MTKALNLSRQLVFQTECTNPRVYVHLLPIGNNLQINLLVQICKSICLLPSADNWKISYLATDVDHKDKTHQGFQVQ